MRGTPAERFWAKVEGDDVDTCWLWNGSTTNGYGSFYVGPGVRSVAHRWAYTQLIGEVPEGLDLDHLCRVRACVNPWHLEPVTRLVNARRGQGNGSQTHCPSGHPYDERNTYRAPRGDRQCRTCMYARARNYQARLRAA